MGNEFRDIHFTISSTIKTSKILGKSHNFPEMSVNYLSLHLGNLLSTCLGPGIILSTDHTLENETVPAPIVLTFIQAFIHSTSF